jgi:hypothetical protein
LILEKRRGSLANLAGRTGTGESHPLDHDLTVWIKGAGDLILPTGRGSDGSEEKGGRAVATARRRPPPRRCLAGAHSILRFGALGLGPKAWYARAMQNKPDRPVSSATGGGGLPWRAAARAVAERRQPSSRRYVRTQPTGTGVTERGDKGDAHRGLGIGGDAAQRRLRRGPAVRKAGARGGKPWGALQGSGCLVRRRTRAVRVVPELKGPKR